MLEVKLVRYFLKDDRNNTCPLYSKSSKIKRVVQTILTAETLSLSEGCDITKRLSDMLFHDRKSLKMTGYTGDQSLYKATHSMKQTLEQRLLVDLAALREMVQTDILWIEKKKTDQ